MFVAVVPETEKKRRLFRPKVRPKRHIISGENFFFTLYIPKGKSYDLGYIKTGLPIALAKDFFVSTPDPLCDRNAIILKLYKTVFLRLLPYFKGFDGGIIIDDKKGDSVGFSEMVAQKVKNVIVVTECQEKYQDFSEICRKNYGLSPIIRSNVTDDKRRYAVFSPKNEINTQNSVVFSPERLSIDLNALRLTEVVEKARPKEIDRLTFAAAVDEHCNIKNIFDASSIKLKFKGDDIFSRNIADSFHIK